jgi:hypothetical protein
MAFLKQVGKPRKRRQQRRKTTRQVPEHRQTMIEKKTFWIRIKNIDSN